MTAKYLLPLLAGLVASLPVQAFDEVPPPVKDNAQAGKGATIGVVLLLLIVGVSLMSPRRNVSQD